MYISGCDELYRVNDTLTNARINYLRTSSDEYNIFMIVLCSDEESKWRTIQGRVDGTVSFIRSHTKFLLGFGGEGGNLWLGINEIHELAKYERRLRIYIESHDDAPICVAFYDGFKVADTDNCHMMTYATFSYGNAGDSLVNETCFKWDPMTMGDGDTKSSGWWESELRNSNLNGRYRKSTTRGTLEGEIEYETYPYTARGIRRTNMAILED